MEEILASIRRIISEEDVPAEAGGDVLELAPTPPPAPEPRPQPRSEPVAAPKLQSQPAVAEARPVAPAFKPPVAEPDEELIVEDYEAPDDEVELDAPPAPPPLQVAPQAARAPAPALAAAPRPVFRAENDDGLIGEPAASAAAGSLGKLMGSMLISSGNTLDDVVRALLKPMLKEWLDAHLPAIVEMEVEKEIDRIRRLAR